MKSLSCCLLVCVLLIACASSKTHSSEKLEGNWELSAFPASDKAFAEIFGQRRPQLQFDVANNRITGTTGCNRLSGTYTLSNDHLHFGEDFITTKMACPGYEESTFLNAFNKINRFDVSKGELLLLHDSTLVMAFARR